MATSTPGLSPGHPSQTPGPPGPSPGHPSQQPGPSGPSNGQSDPRPGDDGSDSGVITSTDSKGNTFVRDGDTMTVFRPDGSIASVLVSDGDGGYIDADPASTRDRARLRGSAAYQEAQRRQEEQRERQQELYEELRQALQSAYPERRDRAYQDAITDYQRSADRLRDLGREYQGSGLAVIVDGQSVSAADYLRAEGQRLKALSDEARDRNVAFMDFSRDFGLTDFGDTGAVQKLRATHPAFAGDVDRAAARHQSDRWSLALEADEIGAPVYDKRASLEYNLSHSPAFATEAAAFARSQGVTIDDETGLTADQYLLAERVSQGSLLRMADSLGVDYNRANPHYPAVARGIETKLQSLETLGRRALPGVEYGGRNPDLTDYSSGLSYATATPEQVRLAIAENRLHQQYAAATPEQVRLAIAENRRRHHSMPHLTPGFNTGGLDDPDYSAAVEYASRAPEEIRSDVARQQLLRQHVAAGLPTYSGVPTKYLDEAGNPVSDPRAAAYRILPTERGGYQVYQLSGGLSSGIGDAVDPATGRSLTPTGQRPGEFFGLGPSDQVLTADRAWREANVRVDRHGVIELPQRQFDDPNLAHLSGRSRSGGTWPLLSGYGVPASDVQGFTADGRFLLREGWAQRITPLDPSQAWVRGADESGLLLERTAGQHVATGATQALGFIPVGGTVLTALDAGHVTSPGGRGYTAGERVGIGAQAAIDAFYVFGTPYGVLAGGTNVARGGLAGWRAGQGLQRPLGAVFGASRTAGRETLLAPRRWFWDASLPRSAAEIVAQAGRVRGNLSRGGLPRGLGRGYAGEAGEEAFELGFETAAPAATGALLGVPTPPAIPGRIDLAAAGASALSFGTLEGFGRQRPASAGRRGPGAAFILDPAFHPQNLTFIDSAGRRFDAETGQQISGPAAGPHTHDDGAWMLAPRRRNQWWARYPSAPAALGPFSSPAGRLLLPSPSPSTLLPSPSPSTLLPSPSPSTPLPSPSPSTPLPSPSPSTLLPSPSPSTLLPSPSPSSLLPSPSPSSLLPSPSPSTPLPSPSPSSLLPSPSPSGLVWSPSPSGLLMPSPSPSGLLVPSTTITRPPPPTITTPPPPAITTPPPPTRTPTTKTGTPKRERGTGHSRQRQRVTEGGLYPDLLTWTTSVRHTYDPQTGVHRARRLSDIDLDTLQAVGHTRQPTIAEARVALLDLRADEQGVIAEPLLERTVTLGRRGALPGQREISHRKGRARRVPPQIYDTSPPVMVL